MSAEENSIFDEINEELKHDAVLGFLKKHQNTSLGIIVLLIAGIVGYSAWYSNKKKNLELATTSLYNELYSSSMKSEAGEKRTRAVLENLQKNAPSELVPLISLIKMGREVGTSEDIAKSAKRLLELSEKRGVDVVWRDLALLMYVSYKLESEDKSLERLEKLTEKDRPFRFTAMEKIAMIYEHKNDHDKAIKVLTSITEDKEAPNSMKERVSRVINYIKNHKDDPKENGIQNQKEQNEKEKTEQEGSAKSGKKKRRNRR